MHTERQTVPRVQDSEHATSVVFVCEHGSAKSLIAASFFNRLATERGLQAQAVSRGTDPDEEVPPVVREGLHADGIELGDVHPVGVAAVDPSLVDLVVVFDVALPAAFSALPVQRWDGMPSVMASYTSAREAIVNRVVWLISTLQPVGTGPASE